MQRRYVWSSENWFGLNSRLKKHDKVSFCVYDDGYRKTGEGILGACRLPVYGRSAEDSNPKIRIGIYEKKRLPAGNRFFYALMNAG